MNKIPVFTHYLRCPFHDAYVQLLNLVVTRYSVQLVLCVSS